MHSIGNDIMYGVNRCMYMKHDDLIMHVDHREHTVYVVHDHMFVPDDKANTDQMR